MAEDTASFEVEADSADVSDPQEFRDKALGLFSVNNWVRIACSRFIVSALCQYLVVALILMNGYECARVQNVLSCSQKLLYRPDFGVFGFVVLKLFYL